MIQVKNKYVDIKNNCIDWIRDQFKNNGNNCNAVIGISGGKDSSVVAALCVEALGKDRVFGVPMPSGYQYDIDVAIELLGYLKIKYICVNIKTIIDEMCKLIQEPVVREYDKYSRYFTLSPKLQISDQSKNNIPPRIRTTILYAIAGSINGRVINTSNLSEDYIGWCTKFGDTAGDLSPLLLLTSTEVIELGKLLLPAKFINKIPEDGLTGKSDEDNFGFTYDILDKYIRTGICDDIEIKNKIDSMHGHNLHKINPMPIFNPSI